MQDENNLNFNLDPAERELEIALAGTSPASVSLRRDELLFAAGAKSARRSLRLWQGTATLLAAGMGLSVFVNIDSRAPRIAQHPLVPPLQQTAIAPPQRDLSPYSLAALRRDVLTGGVEALPSAPPSPDHGVDESPAHSLRPQSILNPLGDPL